MVKVIISARWLVGGKVKTGECHIQWGLSAARSVYHFEMTYMLS